MLLGIFHIKRDTTPADGTTRLILRVETTIDITFSLGSVGDGCIRGSFKPARV
jgi:hypothetical protein